MVQICTIKSSLPILDTETNEWGIFEMPVEVKMVEAAATGDAKGFIQKEISKALAGCVQHTEHPLNEGLWIIEFSRFAQNNFNYPEGFVA